MGKKKKAAMGSGKKTVAPISLAFNPNLLHHRRATHTHNLKNMIGNISNAIDYTKFDDGIGGGPLFAPKIKWILIYF